MKLLQAFLCLVAAARLNFGSLVRPSGVVSISDRESSAVDFVVVTEDGSMLGFDSRGDPLWVWSLGRRLLNETESVDEKGVPAARMVPAIDGSLYVLFPGDEAGKDARIAHVNATIMSVVAESPFSTPAFPNSYLTGSKVQSVESVTFDESFSGWAKNNGKNSTTGRKLMFAVNEWTLSCIDSSSQKQKWGLSFVELSPLTQSHLHGETREAFLVSQLAKEVQISTSSQYNKVTKKISGTDFGEKELFFDSHVMGVYAILDAPDAGGNLVMVLVGVNAPIPASSSVPKIFPEPLEGLRIDYQSGSPIYRSYFSSSGSSGSLTCSDFPLAIMSSGVTPYRFNWPAVRPSGHIALIDRHTIHQREAEKVFSEYRVIDILRIKFNQLSLGMKFYVIVMLLAAFYISRRLYLWILTTRLIASIRKKTTDCGSDKKSPLSIVLPDGTELRQTSSSSSFLSAEYNQTTTMTISSPASSNNRLVLIPSEAIQPYEVIKVGQSDSVEFPAWQNMSDVEAFEKKIKDISHRTAKLPFTHSAASRRPSLDTGNATVLFLGRNVDEPKLVFRNPRAELEVQRPNIPIYTQSIRNAVASSALRDCASLRAYVPRSLCGSWNTFQGVFQEYVAPSSSSSSVGINSFKEAPQSAIDAAFLVLLLRDTDAHDGNYVRDLRRKIALFDLGCALADRPLHRDPIDRMCLDNFEIWKRVPHLLDTLFEDRHMKFLESIDWDSLRDIWTQFEYQEQIVELAKLNNSRLVHPTTMLRIMCMHGKFLSECAKNGKSILFAANVMYGGTYDDVWLECGETEIDVFENRLIELARRSPGNTSFVFQGPDHEM